MWRYTICFINVAGVILVYGQTLAPKICWDTKWYNNSAPTAANRSDYENQPQNVLNSICSYGNVIDAQCIDEKGEPFRGIRNDTVNHYISTCNFVTGLICHPYNNSKALCPDYKIQYGCACATKPSASVTPAPTVGGALVGSISGTTNPGSGNANHVGSGQDASVSSTTGVKGAVCQQHGHGQCGNGVQRYGISQFMLMSFIILKILD